MRIFVILLFLLFANGAHAATCVENNVSRCQELGYTKASCSYGGIACPYDKSLWYCAEYTCDDGRYQTRPISGADCKEVSYKGNVCYDCENTYAQTHDTGG